MQDSSAQESQPTKTLMSEVVEKFRKSLLLLFSKKSIIPFIVFIGIPIVLLIAKNSLNLVPQDNNKFTLVESSPTNQETNAQTIIQPTFVFSKKIGISESQLNKYFHLSPPVSGSWHLEKNRQVVYFSGNKKQANTFPQTFDYKTVYTITIDKKFHSSDNKYLEKDVSVRFKTEKNTMFPITLDKKLLSIFPTTSVDIAFSIDYQANNDTQKIQRLLSSPLNVTIQKSTKEELLQYFSYNTDGLSLNKVPESLSKKAKITTSAMFAKSEKGDGQHLSTTTINGPIFNSPGLYYLTISNNYGSEDLFVVVSNHINQVINDNNNLYVFTTTGKNNIALPNASVEIYSVKNNVKLRDKKITDGDGIAQAKLPSESSDFVITTNNDDVAVTYTYGYGRMLSQNENLTVFSYTDRPIYRPGNTIHYKAVIRKKENGAYSIPQDAYYIQYLKSYSEKADSYKRVVPDENGTVTFDTVLPNEQTETYPQIILYKKAKDGTYFSLDSHSIAVEFYKKPDMEITATSPDKEYISKDTARYTVFGKTNFGQPLSKVSFTYRVLVNDYSEVKKREDEHIESNVYYGGGQEFASGSGIFDAKGVAQIEFSTDLPSKFIQSQLATLEVTPKIGAAPSFSKIIRLIHRGEFALFIENVIGKSNEISGQVSALNHNNPRAAVGNKKGKIYLSSIENYSTPKVIADQDIEIDPSGHANFSFKNVSEGSYEIKLVVDDTRRNTVTSIQITYLGKDNSSYDSNQQKTIYTLSLTPEKNPYKVGETAVATITSNFALQDAYIVLSTNVEGGRSKIISVVKKSINGSVFAYSFPITQDFSNVVGVDIYAIKEGIVLSSHTVINVERELPSINTTILFDKTEYKPGDTVTAKIKTKDKNGKGVTADNSLSIIDASILQLATLQTGINEKFNYISPYIYLNHYASTAGINVNDQGGRGGGCFLEGTQILLGDGTTKNIEHVKIGDTILTLDSDTSSELVKDTVTDTFKHIVSDYMTINNHLHVTSIHKIFLNHIWQEAKNAKIGDTLLDQHGNKVVIGSISYQTGNFRVYNLSTSNHHTFFADGIYVHNDKGDGARQNFVDTLYWNPHVETDANGDATVTFKLSDNVTTFTAQVFSNTKNSLFAEAKASMISHKDITLVPSIANFYYQKDKPTITILIQNSTNQDVDASINTSLKELPGENSQTVHVKSNDLEVVSVPLDLNLAKDSVTFIIEARDKSGKLLDSVLMKRPLLPQGSIEASWISFQGSKNIDFSTQFPQLDFNKVSLSVVPNILSQFFHGSIYFSYDPSITLGKQYYALSYILARTRDGHVSPTAYPYANTTNQFRSSVAKLQEARVKNYWKSQAGWFRDDTFASANLWVAAGLEKAKSMNMLDEITNIDSIVKDTKEYIKSLNAIVANKPKESPKEIPASYVLPIKPDLNQTPTPYLTSQLSPIPISSNTAEILPTMFPTGPVYSPPDMNSFPDFPLPTAFSANDKISRGFILGETFNNDPKGFDKTPEYIAMRVLAGDSKNIPLLLAKKIPSAPDRYFWDDGMMAESAVLPVLALVEKGKMQDVEKAITGLSFSSLTGNADPLAFYAAFRYAERKNIYVEDPSTVVTVNDDKECELTKENLKNNYCSFSKTYTTKNSKDEKIHISVEPKGEVPVYSTVTEFSYVGKGSNSKIDKGNGKSIDLKFSRILRDADSGSEVGTLSKEKTGVVALETNLGMLRSSSIIPNIFSFTSEDAISPGFLYLDQTGYYYNPQYQSVLQKMFPSVNGVGQNYTLPYNYSDQTAFFDGSISQYQNKIILPYVVYNVAGGKYYQPKTSIVFPILGIIVHEK